MARPARVALLTHLRQGLDPGYFLAAIATHHWRPGGIEVVLQQGLRDPSAVDLAILHVDLTRVPPDYLALAARYPRTLNGAVADIAKRRISGHLLSEDDGSDGPVIVKSDLNSGGASERRLRAAARGGPGGSLARAAGRLAAAWRRGPASGRYRVYRRPSLVPRAVWRNPALVVERLFVERHDDLYALNQWFFLGDAEVVSTLLAPVPLVKMASVTARLPLHRAVPQELRQLRRELGFDYGKFDYILEDGRARLIDANRTPHLACDSPLTPRMREVCRTLAGGLEAFL